MRSYPAILIGLASAFIFTPVTAQTSASYLTPVFTDTGRLDKLKATFSEVDKIYRDYSKENHIPGYAFGVVLDGKLVHSGSGGFADLSKKIPASTSTMFRIASMSKSFTAMSILKLRDEGKLALDDPVSRYIPEIKDQRLTADAPEITVRNLLTHSAGFPEDNPWGDRQLANSDEELIALVKKGISFSNDPGLAYEYSNLGFAMLGYIVKKVSGISCQQYVAENIWKPIHMDHAEWEYTKVPAETLVHGYRWIDDKWREEPLMHDGSYGPMGGMITSIDSFSKYVALHLAAWPPRNDAETGPVRRSSIREMHQPWRFNALTPDYKYPDGRTCPTVTAYAYGLSWTRDCEGRVMVAHSGGLPGFGSNWRILPDYGLGVMYFANVTYASTGLANIKVLDTILRLSKLSPRELTVSPILKERQTSLVKLLPEWKDAAKTGIFAQNFFLDYFPDSLRKEATGLFSKAGKIVKVGPMIPENQLRGRFILEGQKANIQVSFTLTPETPALIQEYKIKEIAK